MSVDTNTAGKKLDRYQRLELEDVAVLVPRRLWRWTADVEVDTKRSVLGRAFVVRAGHAHGPGCSHV